MSVPQPKIELLWWEGCPYWNQTLEDLQAAVAQAGLDPRRIVVREIDDHAHAEGERFVGSPTILVDGRDVQPPDEAELPGLTCRIYRLRDGRISPTPDPADLREALERAGATSARG
jgi:hypothetical protein